MPVKNCPLALGGSAGDGEPRATNTTDKGTYLGHQHVTLSHKRVSIYDDHSYKPNSFCGREETGRDPISLVHPQRTQAAGNAENTERVGVGRSQRI